MFVRSKMVCVKFVNSFCFGDRMKNSWLILATDPASEEVQPLFGLL